LHTGFILTLTFPDYFYFQNCLQMFVEVPGEATTGQFAYKGEGHSLCFQLEQMGYYTQCDIKTITMPLLVEVQFLAEDVVSRIICKVGEG
jgi:hypothetical protein